MAIFCTEFQQTADELLRRGGDGFGFEFQLGRSERADGAEDSGLVGLAGAEGRAAFVQLVHQDAKGP